MAHDVTEDGSDEPLDPRFCDAALDGLKSYWPVKLTLRFMKEHGISAGTAPDRQTLSELWKRVEVWMDGRSDRCRDLLEYVDELRMWGRQRVALFEVDAGYASTLADPGEVRKLAGGRYGEPLFKWDAGEPFLAHVEYRNGQNTEELPLVFKVIETRKFDVLDGGVSKTFEERSTNFLVVHPRDRYAELRIQNLPTGAKRDFREECQRLKAELGNYLDMARFTPIELESVMSVMLQRNVYPVTSSRLRFVKPEVAPEAPDTPELVLILDRLFRPSIPGEVSAYWACKQNVIGRRRLHFTLKGTNDHVAFNGVADPVRIGEILKRIVQISRGDWKRGQSPPGGTEENGRSPGEDGRGDESSGNGREKELPSGGRGAGSGANGGDGWVDRILPGLEGQPRAQAAALSAGAVAATILWIAIEGIGKYLIDEWLDSVLGSFPPVLITIAIEIVWLWWYYGTRRVVYSFRLLLDLPRPEVWKALNEARKRGKASRG